MPITIDGHRYHTAGEVADELGVTRQTLWRWRNDGKVPAGRRFRGGHTLFTPSELDEIRAFANYVEPIDSTSIDQLRLFNGGQ